MKRVPDVLEHLGYHEIRGAGESDWRPTEAVNGRYGTTDETHVLVWKRKATAALRDAETGERVATARASCPLFPNSLTNQ
jgi:hypothetical protein